MITGEIVRAGDMVWERSRNALLALRECDKTAEGIMDTVCKAFDGMEGFVPEMFLAMNSKKGFIKNLRREGRKIYDSPELEVTDEGIEFCEEQMAVTFAER